MKVYKPRRLSVMTRPLEEPPHFHLVVTSFLMIDVDSPDDPLLDQALWPFAAEQLGGRPLDVGVAKPRGEVLVVGDAIAPGGRPVESMEVALRLGAIGKRLRVFGERYWTVDPASLEPAITRPQPFERMPLDRSRAFGGPDYALNPGGKGHGAREALARGEVAALPNLEGAARLIRSPDEQPEPVGLGPLDASLPQRRQRLGTFDRTWAQERHPGHPLDTDWSFYNEAPPDQWLRGPLVGDETFTVVGMDPQGKGVFGRLPGLKTRCFLTRRDEPRSLAELESRLDTLWLFPNHRKAVLVFRAVTHCLDEDASDVDVLMVACERLADSPRPQSYYAEVVARRSDPETALVSLMQDSLLMPEIPEEVLAERRRRREALRAEAVQAMRDKRMRRLERTLAKAGMEGVYDWSAVEPVPQVEETLATLPVFLPEELETGDVDLSELIDWAQRLMPDASVLERMQADPDAMRRDVFAFHPGGGSLPPDVQEAVERRPALETDREAQERRVAAASAVPGWEKIDAELDALLADLEGRLAGTEESRVSPHFPEALVPDSPLIDRERYVAAMEQRRETAFDREAIVAKVKAAGLEGGKAFSDARRVSPQPLAPEKPLSPEVAAHIGAVILRRHRQGLELAGHDLAGADLAGADLSGADLSGALLECADLRNADLRGATLDGATLAGALLDGADLRGASLIKTNLSGLRARHADFGEAALEGAVPCVKGDFGGARFDGADLKQLQFIETPLHDSSFRGARLADLFFIKCDLGRACFRAVRGEQLGFVESFMEDVDFGETRLLRFCLMKSRAERARFDRARLEKFVAMGGLSLAESCFRNAEIEGGSLRDVDLRRADFSSSLLKVLDLSGVDATAASFRNAVLERVLLGRARLDLVRFDRAKLVECQLKRVSLNGASLAAARLYAVNGEKLVARQLDLSDSLVASSRLQDEQRRDLL